jgi:hypothetical protein
LRSACGSLMPDVLTTYQVLCSQAVTYGL